MTSNAKINLAIRNFIENCCGSDRSIDCLAEQIGSLRSDRSWSDTEIAVVSQKTIRMLTMLLQPSSV